MASRPLVDIIFVIGNNQAVTRKKARRAVTPHRAEGRSNLSEEIDLTPAVTATASTAAIAATRVGPAESAMNIRPRRTAGRPPIADNRRANPNGLLRG